MQCLLSSFSYQNPGGEESWGDAESPEAKGWWRDGQGPEQNPSLGKERGGKGCHERDSKYKIEVSQQGVKSPLVDGALPCYRYLLCVILCHSARLQGAGREELGGIALLWWERGREFTIGRWQKQLGHSLAVVEKVVVS